MILPEYNNARILIKQITGAIARRIVCACREGDLLGRGEKFGMIKFGSRTELFIPRDLPFEPAVSVGRKVRAGSSIVGRFQRTALQPQARGQGRKRDVPEGTSPTPTRQP